MQSVPLCGQTELSWEEDLSIIPVKKTGCTARWDDPEVPEGTQFCAVTGKTGIYETPEYRVGKEDRRCDRKICRGKPCRCDRIRISGNAGGRYPEEKTETASVEKTGYPETP